MGVRRDRFWRLRLTLEQESIRKLWLALSIILVSISTTVISETQGSQLSLSLKAILGLDFVKNTPDSIVAMWGILLVSIFLIMTLRLVSRHAQVVGRTWRSRFPLRVLKLSSEKGIGRSVALFGTILTVAFPFWALGHSWRVLHNEGVLCALTLPPHLNPD